MLVLMLSHCPICFQSWCDWHLGRRKIEKLSMWIDIGGSFPNLSLSPSRAFRGLNGSMVNHQPLAHELESQMGYILRAFHLSNCLITLGHCLTHLAYDVHRSGPIYLQPNPPY